MPLIAELISLSDCHRHLPIDEAELTACRMFICAIEVKDFKGVLSIAKAPHVPFLGLHPWFVEQAPDDWIEQLEQALIDNPLAQVGECGLDKCPSALDKCPFDKQVNSFRVQVRLAIKHKRVLNIHSVRTLPDIYKILTEELDGKEKLPGVILHSFNGNPEEIPKFVKLNCFFSIGKRYRFDSKTKLKALRRIPKERLLVESDSPDDGNEGLLRKLSPDAGKHSIELIWAVGFKIGQVLDLSVEEVLKQTLNNSYRVVA